MPLVALRLDRDHLRASGGLFLNRHGFDHVYPHQRRLSVEDRKFVWQPGLQCDLHRWLVATDSVCVACQRLLFDTDETDYLNWRTHVCFRTAAELDAFNLYVDNEKFFLRMKS